jgi:hypothetical protein
MAVYDQPKTTYSDTTPQVRVISDAIFMIDPVDTPTLLALGGFDSARGKFQIRQNGYKIEILEDEYDPLTTTANHTTTIATDAVSFPVADASMFQDGHQILVDNEYMVVSAADTSGNTITVYSRAYGGTNSTHASTSAIEIVGMARLEGDDADYGPIVDITAPYNYTSIFQKGVKVSETERVIDQYGFSDAFVYQSNKAVPHLLRLLDKSIFHGIRAAGSASAPRSMGGLGTFVTNNSTNAGGGIVKADVDYVMELVHLDGGNPDLLVINPSIGNDLRNILDTSSFVRVGQDNSQLGMEPITRVSTQYGPLTIVQDRFCPLSKAWILDSRKVGLYQLRPFQMKPLAVTGDSSKGEVVGEFSLLVANDAAHGLIYGITS